jgi:hypothetical protein
MAMNAHRRRIESLEKRIEAPFSHRGKPQKEPFDWEHFERVRKAFDDEHPNWREHIPQSTWDGLRRYLNGDESRETDQKLGEGHPHKDGGF